ncbi:UNVERIFIED_CONTAM: hypothetical protein RMT77_002589 [Armadillidium vulgare]
MKMSLQGHQTSLRRWCHLLRFLTLFLLTRALSEGSFLQELAEEVRPPFLFKSVPAQVEELRYSSAHEEIEEKKEELPSRPSEDLPVLRLPSHPKIYDVPLDINDTLHLYWQIDYETESVRIEIHSRAFSPHPWVAVGFSDRGEFPGSDMCVFWVDWKKKIHFQNAEVDEDGRLKIFERQHCINFRYRSKSGVLKFTFSRHFDTCEPMHYVIERGTTHIVWAWGLGPLYSLEGVIAKGDYCGQVKLELLKPALPDPNLENSKELLVRANKVSVPSDETTYWCSVQKLPEEFLTKHHMLKFGPRIEKGNEDVVHHMEVFHCEHPHNFEVPLYQGPCHTDSRPKEIDACKRVLAAWAMGATAFAYPDEAGLPIGGKNFNQFVMLEVHYNNPNHIQGRVDNSGLVITYSSKLRNYDAAIMELGLEYTSKMAIPPKMKSFTLAGYCIPECTALSLPPDGIYIFGSQLHTHLTGVRTWTKHYRGDLELPEMNRDNHYSTHFQEIRRLPNPVQVLPGDALIMGCEYSTPNRVNVTVGGFAISDEMCVNYVHYYPKVDLEVCKSSVDSQTLINYFDFMNSFELEPTSPEFGWRENYKSIEWTPLRANFLQNMYEEAPLSMQCNRSNGERFPGYWENKAIPQVLHKLRKPERKCKRKLISKENGEIIVV